MSESGLLCNCGWKFLSFLLSHGWAVPSSHSRSPFLIPAFISTNSEPLVKFSHLSWPHHPYLEARSNDSRCLTAKHRTCVACSGHTTSVSRWGTLCFWKQRRKAVRAKLSVDSVSLESLLYPWTLKYMYKLKMYKCMYMSIYILMFILNHLTYFMT